ncbi:MAG: hypothetical protein ACUVUB_08025 [Candidatus Bathyarchaeia archaeon]
MGRRSAAMMLLGFLLIQLSCIVVSATGQGDLKLLSVTFPKRVEAGQSADVTVTLTYGKAMIPTVIIYYIYFINQTMLAGGWRISQAKLEWTGEGVSIYKAVIPNPAYIEAIPYNSKVVFYLEAKELSGRSLLTCGDATRWDPYTQHDKYFYLIVDTAPPKISEMKVDPERPTELDPVTVTVKAVDDASGVARVELNYWIGDVKRLEVMNQTYAWVYAATIPPQPSGVKVTCHVTVLDRDGNKASAGPLSYTVITSPSARAYQSRGMLIYLAIVGAATLLGATVYIWRSGWRLPPRFKECEHPWAMTIFMLLSLLVALIIYYQLSELGSLMIGLLVFGVAVASWGILDPRVTIPVPDKLRLDRSPPLTLMVEGLIIGLVTAVTVAASASLGLHSIEHAYEVATLTWRYVVGLMVTSLILQVAWPHLKDIKFSIEVEELENGGGE